MAFKFSENRGKLFENILFLELKRRKKEVYYYKTTAGYEVDFVAREKGVLELIQVCIELHAEAEKREIRALVQAAHELKLNKGIVVTAETEKEWVLEGVRITAIPLYKFLFKS